MSTSRVEVSSFTDAADLGQAIAHLLETAKILHNSPAYQGKPVVYVRSEQPFDTAGVAVLVENRLTDGSKTYDIVLGPEA